MGNTNALKRLESALLFANTVVTAMGKFAHVSVMQLGENHQYVATGQWAGSFPHGTPTRAPQASMAKLAEILLESTGCNGNLVCTPVEGNQLSLGWFGGVGQKGCGVGVSKWEPELDQLLALLVLYHMTEDSLILHHIGFRYSSMADYREACAMRPGGVELNAPDHLRTYFKEGDHWVEYQYFPKGPYTAATHIDVATVTNPEYMFDFLHRGTGVDAVLWDDIGGTDPSGAIWVQGTDSDHKLTNSRLGVMVRMVSHWWEPVK